MTREPWPQKVYVKQEQLGSNKAGIYNADNGTPLNDVLDVDIHLNGTDAEIDVTRTTTWPPTIAGTAPTNPDEFDYQGVVAEKRRYIIKRLEAEGIN